jgi:alpha/beta superfamily hydrolase
MENIMGSRGPTQSGERAVRIQANENINIHGIFRGEAAWPLAVLAPGLGGWMNDLLLFNASRYFEEQGIATLRVSFYGHDDKQRNIGDFGVKENAVDIDAVVDFAREQDSPWICVVGHSYSGMAIVYSQNKHSMLQYSGMPVIPMATTDKTQNKTWSVILLTLKRSIRMFQRWGQAACCLAKFLRTTRQAVLRWQKNLQ